MPRGIPRSVAKLASGELLTRNAACRLLGLSRSAVRSLDGVHLTPITVSGRICYRRADVDAVLGTRSGASAQQAFAVFARGGGPADVVLEHAMPPDLADRLWDFYLRLRQKQASTLVIELPTQVSAAAWRRAHGYDQITPDLVRTALEAYARDPELRALMLSQVESENADSRQSGS